MSVVSFKKIFKKSISDDVFFCIREKLTGPSEFIVKFRLTLVQTFSGLNLT